MAGAPAIDNGSVGSGISAAARGSDDVRKADQSRAAAARIIRTEATTSSDVRARGDVICRIIVDCLRLRSKNVAELTAWAELMQATLCEWSGATIDKTTVDS
jgi:hypothetical protein